MSSFFSEEGLCTLVFGATGWAVAFVGTLLILIALMFDIDTKGFK